VFSKSSTSVRPEVIDEEYLAFVADLTGNKAAASKTETAAESAPPAADAAKIFEQSSCNPLMLTNGSAAPGAASAYARSQTIKQQQPQVQCSGLQSVGKSIFGGKMTKMTSGYKTKVELELELEKKKRENEYRPVPMEWQVERIEKSANRQQVWT
jgi:hypothetical protein